MLHLKKWTSHLLVWAAWYGLEVSSLALFNERINALTLIQLLGHSIELALLIYFNLYVLIPRLLDSKKYILYTVSAIGTLVAVSFASIHLDLGETQSKNLPSHLLGATFYTIVGTLIGLFQRSLAMNKKLREQQLIAELDLLKAQVNPHFFFNTLNSVYSISLESPEKTSAAILQLSELMHYMFKVTQLHLIPLRQEIQYITHYIDLEKARFGEKCQASIEVTGPVDSVEIPPLILLPFVENAFKHGTEVSTGRSFVRVDVAVQHKEFFFQVSNSIGDQQQIGSGTGLRNVRKRLDLLFKNRYDLQVTSEHATYVATLRLDLN
jgi:sensor histidine kinase YesM